jgi:hypothetical protein
MNINRIDARRNEIYARAAARRQAWMFSPPPRPTDPADRSLVAAATVIMFAAALAALFGLIGMIAEGLR